MKSLSKKRILGAIGLLFFFPGRLLSQGLDPAIIANPPADYSGRRHSALTQITPQNVASIGLAWAFQTGQEATIKSSPLLVDGVLYFTVPDNVWAVDARTLAPLVLRDHVILGVGDLDNIGAYMRSIDPRLARHNGNGT